MDPDESERGSSSATSVLARLSECQIAISILRPLPPFLTVEVLSVSYEADLLGARMNVLHHESRMAFKPEVDYQIMLRIDLAGGMDLETSV